MKLFDLIPVGEENSVSRKELAALVGLSDRSLRLAIHRERLRGCQILANSDGGYYRPEHSRDTVRFIRSMRRRAAETAAVADALEAALDEESGQSRIGGV